MLGGLDPIIIFNFKKIPPGLTETAKMPLVASIIEAIDLPAIPIYLSEKLTGIFIESEDKAIDIDTKTDAQSNGSAPIISQRPISSTVKINMLARRDSIGVMLFSAMADLVFPKVTSKEYSITYLHGAVTVFAGLLDAFSISQENNTDLYRISLSLVKPALDLKSSVPVVPKVAGAIPLEGVV